MTDPTPPKHLADPERERLAHPTELQHRRPGANFTGWSRALVYGIPTVLALAAALVIVLLILTQISALP